MSIENAGLPLHNDGPCMFCCDAGIDFDYCRCCGFTVYVIKEKQEEQKGESSLVKALKRLHNI